MNRLHPFDRTDVNAHCQPQEYLLTLMNASLSTINSHRSTKAIEGSEKAAKVACVDLFRPSRYSRKTAERVSAIMREPLIGYT